MEIFEYLKEKKKIYDAILEFLESESDAGLHFQNLIEILESQNIRDNKKDFKLLIQIINRISEGHFQTTSFIQRVEHILLYLRDDILQNLSNNQIFNIFKGNKRLLLFLFENQMLKHNKIITFYIMKNDNYLYYLIPEMKDILDDRYEGVLNELHRYRRGSENNYEEKRRIGQNEELGAELIREDKLEEFINFLKEYGIPLKEYDLPCSPFDTNYLMRKRKQTSLLEYAAFFGSLRTFKYLKENKLPLTSSLWIYGVHSKSIAMIRLLEEYRVPFDDKCLEEAIRCHHNDVARYILSYLVDRKVVLANIKNNFMENVFSYAFHYHNFEFIPTKFEDKFAFYYFCYYGYFHLVEIYTRIKKVDLNSKIHVSFKIKNKEETLEISKSLFFF